MKNNDCLFSDIQNLCNAASDWLIKKINNPIKANETTSCACCHMSVWWQRNQLNVTLVGTLIDLSIILSKEWVNDWAGGWVSVLDWFQMS